MKLESILKSAAVCSLTLALSVAAFSQHQNVSKDQTNKTGKQAKTVKDAGRSPYDDHVIGTTRDEEKQSKKAASAFKEFMKISDRRIPQNVFDRAQCVAAFPNAYRDGAIASGRGVISCRTGGGWSAPIYLNLSGGVPGSQIGPEPSDVVMVFMDKEIISSLPAGKFTIGADALAAAGPVGSGAATNSQILCYSRSKEEVAGVMIDGATIEIDQDDMRDVYGDGFDSKKIMEDARTNARSGVMAFSETLSRYASRQARK